MRPSFLAEIQKNKNKKKEKSCTLIYPHEKEKETIPSQFVTEIVRADPQRLFEQTKHLVVIPPGCRLKECHPIQNLVSRNHRIPNKNVVRMFHGTTSRYLSGILKHGLKTVGGGALGKGFYVTPSFEKASIYTAKVQQQHSSGYPLFIEVYIPYDTPTGCFEPGRQGPFSREGPSSREGCCPQAMLYTNPDELWQFVIKDQTFLGSLFFRILIE